MMRLSHSLALSAASCAPDYPAELAACETVIGAGAGADRSIAFSDCPSGGNAPISCDDDESDGDGLASFRCAREESHRLLLAGARGGVPVDADACLNQGEQLKAVAIELCQ